MMLLASCFPGEGFFEQQEINAEQVEEISVQLVGETATANLSSSSTITQKITVPEGSSIQGASLAIPPGTLSVDMAINIEETISIASLQGGDQVEYSNYAAVGYSNNAGVEQVSQPMTLQIPLSESSTLNLAVSKEPNAVKLRVNSPGETSGVCKEQFILDDEFSILSNDVGSVIELQSKFFGAYQPVRLVSDFYQKLKDARDIVKEKIANGTASPEELLSSKSGCPIVTKTQKKELDVKYPVVMGDITSSIKNRSISLSTIISSTSPLVGCSVFFRNGFFIDNDPLVVNSTTSKVEIDFTNILDPIKGAGRFECSVEDGRKVEKNFKNINLNPGVSYDLDLSARTIIFTTGMLEGGQCTLELKSLTSPYEAQSELVADPKKYVLDFSQDTDAVQFEGYFRCVYSDGSVLKTDTGKFSIPECTSCTLESNAPELTSIQFPNNVLSPSSQTVDIYASDDSGMGEFCFGIKAVSGYTGVPAGCYNLSKVSTDHYQATINVPAFLPVQSYDISYFSVRDIVGNERFFYLDSNGYYKSHTYVQGQSHGTDPGVDTAIMAMGFTVAATTGHNPDTIAPSLVDIISFPNAMIANQVYNVSISVTDGGGSANAPDPYVGICLELSSTGGQTNVYQTCLSDIQYTGGTINGNFSLYSEFENGEYFVDKLFLIDLATNQSLYNADASIPPTSFLEAGNVVPPLFTFSGGSDHTPPSVSSVIMDSSVYDVGGGAVNATLITTATDVSGVGHICLKIDLETWSYPIPLGCNSSTDNGDGTYNTVFTLPNYFMNATNYQPVDLEIYDNKGNKTHLYKISSSDTFYTIAGSYSSISINSFSFINAATDSIAPTINNVSLSTSTLAANSNISISIDVTDSGISGINLAEACATFRTSVDLRSISVCNPLISMGGSIYQLNVLFDPWVENDTYKLTDLSLTDKAANSASLYAMWADTLYTSTSIAVPGVTVSGATLDTNPPILNNTAAYFTSGSYYYGDLVELTFSASDAISGIDVNEMCSDLTNGTDWYYVCGNLTALGGGLYSFEFHMPSTYSTGLYYPEDIMVYDKAGNSSYYYTSGSAMAYSPDPGWMPPTFYYYP